MSNDLRRGRHVVYNLHVHLVFVAKYRRKVFTKEILDDMQAIFEEVCSKFEAQLVEFDGECDHVHLLVVYPPKVGGFTATADKFSIFQNNSRWEKIGIFKFINSFIYRDNFRISKFEKT